jgi:hypothetical protein
MLHGIIIFHPKINYINVMKIYLKIASFFFIYFLVAINGNIYPQSVGYSYDLTGNRTGRHIILQASMKTSMVGEEENEPEVVEDILNGHQVLIYPNPTKGLLKVEFKDLPDTSVITVSLFHINGEMILRKKADSPIVELDLSMQPNGMYILTLTDLENNNTTTWKIIKQ